MSPALGEILAQCAQSGRSVYLFGADAATLYRLRDQVGRACPDLKLAGLCDAAFDGPVSRDILADMASCRPDLLIADVPARLFRQLEADGARLMPGLRIVNLRHGLAAGGRGERAGAWLTDRLPPALREALLRRWRSVGVHLRFGRIVIRQKLRLASR